MCHNTLEICQCNPKKLITVGNVLEQAGYVKKKEWVSLTDEERYLNCGRTEEEIEYAKAIEAKLKEKNT